MFGRQDQDRQSRQRHQALATVVENTSSFSQGQVRFIGQVTTNGTLPTGADTFYLLNPAAGLNASECEACSGTLVADTTKQIAVDVLNGAPNLGDWLVAYAVGGKWVAERGSSVCCNWLCSDKDMPNYFDVVDPVYGSFRLPLVRHLNSCIYVLDTYLNFTGNGDCPAGMIPVHFQIDGQGFQMWINTPPVITSSTCAPGMAPFQTNCHFVTSNPCTTDFDHPNFDCWIDCPTNLLAFPAVNGPPYTADRLYGVLNALPSCDDITHRRTATLNIPIHPVVPAFPLASNP